MINHQRSVLNFNHDWKFIKEDVKGGEQIHHNDTAWADVSAPHTYNDVDTFAHYQSKNHTGERDQWQGRTWYRKHFTLPASTQGKKVFIEFEAARQLAEVYLNGTKVGLSENGFVPFGFDLTPHLIEGENILAVMCDNTFVKDEEGEMKWSTYEGGAKFSWNNPHWHPAHGGLYRNVYLHVTDKLHITLPLYNNMKTVGAYVFTPEVCENEASVGVEVEVRNENDAHESFTMLAEIINAEGQSVLKLSQNVELTAGQTDKVHADGKISRPILWDPERPYQYSVRISITKDGEIIDDTTVPLGFRTWSFCAKTGFKMNDRTMKLQGWGQKSTNEWAGLGNAMPDWMQHYTLELMREAGGNLVRWGHTAGSPAQVKSADQLGLVTIQPGVDGEGDLEGHSWEVRLAAFRDTVVYYRNNPSIFVWEGGNQAVTLEHVLQLREVSDTYDPHGKRAYAHRRPSKITNDHSDLEIGTQGGHKFRDKPVVEGEYNREECPRRIWDNFSPPDYGYNVPRPQEYELTSESFAANQVIEYVQRIGGADHCGGANWIFSDSTSGGRNDCEVTRAGGIVDAVRLKKEAFYSSKAIFHWEPQVHLIGHWTYPEDRKTVKSLYVVSNGIKVELLINGVSKGFGEANHRYLFIFKDISWEAGTVTVVAYDDEHNEVARQSKETVGPALSLKITPITGPKGFYADGSDIALFDIEVIDAQGRRHPTIEQRVDFELEGPAIWRGGYNSGIELSTNHHHLNIESGINRVAVKATRETGTIILRAKSAGLASAEASVNILPYEGKGGTSSSLPQLQSPLPYAELNLVNEVVEGLSFEQSEGNYIEGFSYSGTRFSLPVQKNAEDGMLFYVDRDDYMNTITENLRGADYIQTADEENMYEAVDLMDFTVNRAGTLLIAHDDRLQKPAWMKAFKKNTEGLGFEVGGHHLSFYTKEMEQNESITLGSNREAGPTEGHMYIVVFKPHVVAGL